MANDLGFHANTLHPDVTPPRNAERVLADAVRDLVEATDEVARLEAELAVAKEWRDALAHRDVPDAMHDVGTETIVVDERTTVTLERRLHCHVLKPEKQNVLQWIKGVGRSDLLSVEFSIEFARGDYAKAREFVKAVDQVRATLGIPKTLIETWGIAAPTLKKFVGESYYLTGKLDQLPKGITYFNDTIAVVQRAGEPAPSDEENPLT